MSKKNPTYAERQLLIAKAGERPTPTEVSRFEGKRRRNVYFNNIAQLDLVQAAASATGEMLGQFVRTAAMNRVCSVLGISTGEAAVAFLRSTGGQYSDSGLMEMFEKLEPPKKHGKPNCREAAMIELARLEGKPVTVAGLFYAITRGGVKCTPSSVRRVLADMQHDGVVERVAGPGRAVKYRLIGGNGDE